jgi:hypothetical protein
MGAGIATLTELILNHHVNVEQLSGIKKNFPGIPAK